MKRESNRTVQALAGILSLAALLAAGCTQMGGSAPPRPKEPQRASDAPEPVETEDATEPETDAQKEDG